VAVLVPDLLYRDNAFHAGLALEVDEATGRIVRITDSVQGDDTVALPRRALVPGFINAHSHAFQRLIRGRTQWRPMEESVADFWTWREAMYASVLCLSPDDVYAASRLCFIEMLRAGITSVGEFHYLHNDVSGAAYSDATELAERVIAAALDTGIRIALLNVCYATGAIGEPLRPEQRRFATPDLDAFLLATDAVRTAHTADARVSVGVAPHSVRAVPREWLGPIAAYARERDVPLHMHASEQTGEVEACLRAYGMRPIELLHEDGLLDSRFTAVHATHVDDEEVRLLGRARATVCACPTTERDLGDGFLRAFDLLSAGAPVALGSDSQTVIDPLEDARLAEYNERLLRRSRVVLATALDDRLEVAPVLLRMATASGARSLRLHAGVIEDGALADLAAIDLEHVALAGWSPDSLGAMLMLSAPSDVICDVWVGGRRVIDNRAHRLQEEAMRDFERVARRVLARA
jgi:formimidoylglutamate deiminase